MSPFTIEITRDRRSNSKRLRPRRTQGKPTTNVGDPNKGASSSGKKKG